MQYRIKLINAKIKFADGKRGSQEYKMRTVMRRDRLCTSQEVGWWVSGVNKQVIRVMNGAGAAVAGQVPCHL